MERRKGRSKVCGRSFSFLRKPNFRARSLFLSVTPSQRRNCAVITLPTILLFPYLFVFVRLQWPSLSATATDSQSLLKLLPTSFFLVLVKMVTTRTTPKASKPVSPSNVDIHPVTPAQTREPSSASPLGSASLPLSGTLRRRSLRLASISDSDSHEPRVNGDSSGNGIRVLNELTGNGSGHVRDGSSSDSKSCSSSSSKGKGKRKLGTVMKKFDFNGSVCDGDERGKGFLSLRSGKKIVKRGLVVPEDQSVGNGQSTEPSDAKLGNGGLSVDIIGTAKRGRKLRKFYVGKEEMGKDGSRPNSIDAVKLDFESERQNVSDPVVDVEGSEFDDSKPTEERDNRGKRKLDGRSRKGVVTGNVDEGSSHGGIGSASRRRFSREEKGKGVLVDGDLSRNVVLEAELVVQPDMKISGNDINSVVNNAADNVALQDQERLRNTDKREHGSRRNEYMERFRDIARENASRFAHFAPDEEVNPSSHQLDEKNEIEDWPGPFSTAMKIIKDRGMKSIQTGSMPSEGNLPDPITWVPKRNQGHIGTRPVPSLQELCLKLLAKNVDAIVSLDCVPDAMRHRLSQLLCDSRKINSHFFELLVKGSPTEIRLRDCSWLTEEQFIKCFQLCDTANLVVLQLDQCGRCIPDCVLLATLAQSPRKLPRLISLSLSGACRLSDVGLRTLISSAPALRSINLSQCSLLTSASISILAESLKSLLKELYLDDCQGIDTTLIVPALKELEHLEVLSVAGIQTVCDKFIKDYIITSGHNMKELVLKDCVNLTDASMKVIAGYCPGLYALDIMNLCQLTDLSIGYLTNGCRELHTLKLCRNPCSDEALAAYVETSGESLKELSLNNVKKVGHHTTLSLASHAKNLHTLDLSWCRNLTDSALGLIVDSCLSLRVLKLFGCTQVTDVFLNGHSNLQIQIIGLKMSSVLQHVKVPNPHQGVLNYSSVSVNLL